MGFLEVVGMLVANERKVTVRIDIVAEKYKVFLPPNVQLSPAGYVSTDCR